MDMVEIANMTLNIFLEILLIIVFVYALSKTKWFKSKNSGFLGLKGTLAYIAVFGILMIFATNYFKGAYGDAFINLRSMAAMVGGLVGGPAVGLGAGLIGGLDRILIGGTVALPCSFATVLSGIIGGLIWVVAGRKYPKLYVVAIAMFLIECLHLILIATISNPPSVGMDVAQHIMIPQILFNVVGVIIFTLFYNRYIRVKETDTGD